MKGCGLIDCRCEGDELLAERDRLAARIRELENGTAYKLAGAVAAQINQKNEELQAENTRLREALEKIAEGSPYYDCDIGCAEMAKEALEEKP